jgi:hypothetical protein
MFWQEDRRVQGAPKWKEVGESVSTGNNLNVRVHIMVQYDFNAGTSMKKEKELRIKHRGKNS